MSLVKDIQHKAIDDLIQSSMGSEHNLEWIPYSQITGIKPTQIDNVYYANRKRTLDADRADITIVMLLLLGGSEECTPTLVSEFSRVYSLPTHKYSNADSLFRRYSTWLKKRNRLINGFTKHDGSYYLVAKRQFYYCYSRYGFCTACGILRCSPVWCICGHKQLSDGWTSSNKKLDEFIKTSQLQTNSANDVYLEWIPFDYIDEAYGMYLHGLPTRYVNLIPLEITDETQDLDYAELCDKHPDILTTDVWVTIGFTYVTSKQTYCLIKRENGLCLACTGSLSPKINLFCYHCGTPRLRDWTTGNKSLDSFVMESWKNTRNEYDAYIQWIECSLLTNMQEMTSLRHGCTHIADMMMNGSTRVMLKKIIGDFYQLTEEYPEILTPENVWIVGITQVLSTRDYYLVFYYDVHALLDKLMRNYKCVKYMQYSDFYELKEIGAGGYGTVYTAKYENYSKVEHMPQTVVLKRFHDFDETPELFISEFRNHAKCASHRYSSFLRLYGITQDPETKEYMTVMQYANNGSLLSYLDQNINKLTWRKKLVCLRDIAHYLNNIHRMGLVHCDLHGGNVVLNGKLLYICDLGLSRSVNSRESNSTIRGVLPFIAPEVFHTRKFTQKSDVYSFGIIMHLIATGEPPFRDRQFDRGLVCDIMGGLRPSMPDSAPEKYKKCAEWCCDADPDKRPDAHTLARDIDRLCNGLNDNDYIWNAIYHNDVKPLSRLEKECKYSSTILPAGDLPKPRNSHDSRQLPPLSDFSLPSLEIELEEVDEK